MDRSNTDNSNEQRARLNVQVDLGQVEGNKRVEAVAYIFSSGGRLLGQAPVNEQGLAAVELPARMSEQQLQVVVGPKAEGEPTLATLERRGIVSSFLETDQVRETLAGKAVALKLPPETWQFWLRRCTVRGHLYKWVGGGSNAPIPHATVEVYEVDPLWLIIPKLPDLRSNTSAT